MGVVSFGPEYRKWVRRMTGGRAPPTRAGTPRYGTAFPSVRAPGATARPQIVCFPFAGGGASAYRQWGKAFRPDIDVCALQLPGREDRLAEPLLRSVDAVVEALVPVLKPVLDGPYVLFGHSMGALIIFGVARRLAASGGPLPRHLFVSAHRAPDLPDRRSPLHPLPEPEFIERLRTFAGTPELVFEEPDLAEIVLPILRADFELCETYEYADAAPLPCPITAFGGVEDPTVDRDELDGWRRHTSARFDLRMFPGGHFYLRGAEDVLADHISSVLVP